MQPRLTPHGECQGKRSAPSLIGSTFLPCCLRATRSGDNTVKHILHFHNLTSNSDNTAAKHCAIKTIDVQFLCNSCAIASQSLDLAPQKAHSSPVCCRTISCAVKKPKWRGTAPPLLVRPASPDVAVSPPWEPSWGTEAGNSSSIAYLIREGGNEKKARKEF